MVSRRSRRIPWAVGLVEHLGNALGQVLLNGCGHTLALGTRHLARRIFTLAAQLSHDVVGRAPARLLIPNRGDRCHSLVETPFGPRFGRVATNNITLGLFGLFARRVS
jgi:hypothetical protein